MRHTKNFLARCEALWRSGVKFSFDGQVARGFADLGYEEFIVLPDGKKIVSVLSGTTSEVPEDGSINLFSVPSPDEALSKLIELGASGISFRNLEERSWELTLTFRSKELRILERTLEGVLIEGLILLSKFD